MYKLIISSIFTDMLEDIITDYSVYSAKYTYAIRLAVYNAINILQTCPYAFQMVSTKSGLRKCVIKNRFSIIYKIHKNEVELLYFIDNRRLNDSYMVEEAMELYIV